MASVSPTTADVLEGIDDLRGWDDEEIRRGQKRTPAGKYKGRFIGPPPKLVAQAVHTERHRRTLSKAHELFTENVVTAVEVLIDIATDITASHSDRLKAASLIVERAMGKATQSVEVSLHEPKFLAALEAGIVTLETDAPDDIVDAEVVWD